MTLTKEQIEKFRETLRLLDSLMGAVDHRAKEKHWDAISYDSICDLALLGLEAREKNAKEPLAVSEEVIQIAKEWSSIIYNEHDCPPGSKLVNYHVIVLARELLRLHEAMRGGK